jgi:hypothetical protein
MKIRPLVGAAVAGGLIWASRQDGGVKGTWHRLKECINDVKAGENVGAATRRFFRGGYSAYDQAAMHGA